MNNVILIGADDVARAGHTIAQAAKDMQQAATTIDSALFQQRQFMTDWLNQLERILQDDRIARDNK